MGGFFFIMDLGPPDQPVKKKWTIKLKFMSFILEL
jgi:hypothetical protein